VKLLVDELLPQKWKIWNKKFLQINRYDSQGKKHIVGTTNALTRGQWFSEG
jgi:hypothetical protein